MERLTMQMLEEYVRKLCEEVPKMKPRHVIITTHEGYMVIKEWLRNCK